ncbi:MAG: acetylxylan esterase [Verrucomicrobia bacterium]|nr:acetylxylan esterase [Verrucomicrobiota bacterium]
MPAAAGSTLAWAALAAWFKPPAQWAGQGANYRSPLRFDDGSRVRTAADWERRRAELLNAWHGLMGPWPPVLERPAFDVLSVTNRDTFVQTRIRLELARGQTGEGWLLTPRGDGPFPAVLVVYYEPETSVGLNPKQPGRDFALQLTRRGFVTLSLGTPGGNAWKPELGAAQCQPLSYHAYVAANAWHALANLSAVDRRRIGVVGHSYGGKWALFAGALWEKFAAVAVSDPGIVFDERRPNVNYWEPWYLGREAGVTRARNGVPSADNPRRGAYRRMVEAGRDLHELHALIAPRPLLVSGGAEDPPSRWAALNHAVAVNALLGYSNRVGLTRRPGHAPTPESNAQLGAFFDHFLKNSAQSRD